MRVRHRIPSIFNLSMVDVLCCALGCVILLWLINLREAREHEENAEEQQQRIGAELAGLRAERDKAVSRTRQLETRLETLQMEKNDLQKSLNARQSEVKKAASRVAVLENDLRQSEKRRDKETARSRELAEALTAERMRVKELQTTANRLSSLQAELKEAREQYAAEKALATTLEKEIANRMRELKDSSKSVDKLADSRRSLERDLEARDKELALARRSLSFLREQNKTLEAETTRVRAAAENRFAGITLTGRRVLFLVDISGSMDLVDENTKAPTKWTDVRATVVRLMDSLPDLRKYQVIVFAEKPAFLFASEEDWLDYNARSSPERVRNSLAKLTPKGGTNMYAALQLAFRFRARGMDTVYLFSDGLPNLGEGLGAQALNALKEAERNNLLARYIRRTLQSDWNRALPGQPRVRINAIGFFYESPDVGAFLWALARENDGSFVGMSKP
ncbi:MAG: vWA domain-containing protein [Gemmataceae bacterium]